MSSKMQKDDAYEITDSTDWLETSLRSLAAVDSALRCQVCKDFYSTPMITSCSHTFCSLCIRRCLNNDGRCPACRKEDQEIRLRFNGAIEDLVEAFKVARPEVYNLAKTKPVVTSGTFSPKRNRKALQDEGEEQEENETPARKRQRPSRQRQPIQEMIVADTDEEDEDFVPEEGLVKCPICNGKMKEEKINAHLDRDCKEEPSSKFSKLLTFQSPSKRSQNLEKRPERLAAPHYAMMKDRALMKKLGDQGLQSYGTRQVMEKRYTEWATLWNANCDATNPKSRAELKRELDIWERNQGPQASSYGSAPDPGAKIKDKTFDTAAWSAQHDDSFKKLVADARKKAKEAKALQESKAESTASANALTPAEPLIANGVIPYPLQPQYQKTHNNFQNPSYSISQANQQQAHFINTSNMGVHETKYISSYDMDMNTIRILDKSQGRFFDEPSGSGNSTGNYTENQSLQYSHSIPVFEKEPESGSDITIITNVQP